MTPQDSPASPAYRGCAIPPEIHAVGFGWDPQPEVDRFLFLARDAGVTVRRALELGCGTGRLLGCMRRAVDEIVGLELSPTAAAFARSGAGVEVHVGDMSEFRLPGAFDLIYASANTIRHVRDEAAIRGMWECIADHLTPPTAGASAGAAAAAQAHSGGVFIADVQLGHACDIELVRRPATWVITRGETTVRATWGVVKPPTARRPVSLVEWSFESRGASAGCWSERFELRAYEPREFLSLATASGRLECAGLYELRDPYLVPLAPEKAVGRMLVVLLRREPV